MNTGPGKFGGFVPSGRRVGTSRPGLRVTLALCLCVALRPASAAQYRDLALTEAVELLERAGLSIIFSSDVIKPWMRVEEEPVATQPRAILEEILRPYGVAVAEGPAGSLLLVRARESLGAHGSGLPRIRGDVPEIARIVVSASQYELLRDPISPVRTLSAADLHLSPDVGDDPMRAISRLPGTASADFTAKTNVRGGEVDETLVRFDGLRLFNPFHFKDFQSLFSTIDPGLVSGMNVYTGGYPAAYGDRMSGVIDIASLPSSEETLREISLSFFTASVLATGSFEQGGGDWLFSVRRGNPDVVIEARGADIGRPSYFDVHARLGRRLGDAVKMSANFLLFEDDITLFDGDREEQARADYQDAYYWLRFDFDPTRELAGRLLLARTDMESARSGSSDQPGLSSGMLDDRRDFALSSLQSDWSWRIAHGALLQFGGEWRASRGHYEFRDRAQYDLVFDSPEFPAGLARTRDLRARLSGDQYGAYTNLRIEPVSDLVADIGLRWDRETLSPRADDQLSPRIGLLYRVGEAITLRASWGRYFQAQAVNELQISDGVTDVFGAQRSNHFVGSFEYSHPRGFDVRVEAYRKTYSHLRPRFENLLNTFVLLPELKPDRIRIAPDRATAKGVEVSAGRPGDSPLSWWLSYSWSTVEDVLGTDEIRRSWDQQHAGGGGIAWRTPRWEFSVAAKYHTGWPTTEVRLVETGPIAVVQPGPRNARRQKNYATLDARVARHFQFEGQSSLMLFVELVNVLSRANPCCIEYGLEDEDPDVPPFIEIEQVEALPLVPSIGFVWRF